MPEISLPTYEQVDNLKNYFHKRNKLVFDAAGTINWTVPVGVKTIYISAIGGAGGGGGGGGGHLTSIQYSGGGGGGGACGEYVLEYPLEVVEGQVYKLTIGAGGAGGAGVAIGLNGIDGGNGGSTSFHDLLTVVGGNGGKGGKTTQSNEHGAGGAGGKIPTTLSNTAFSFFGKNGGDGETSILAIGGSRGSVLFSNLYGGYGGSGSRGASSNNSGSGTKGSDGQIIIKW